MSLACSEAFVVECRERTLQVLSCSLVISFVQVGGPEDGGNVGPGDCVADLAGGGPGLLQVPPGLVVMPLSHFSVAEADQRVGQADPVAGVAAHLDCGAQPGDNLLEAALAEGDQAVDPQDAGFAGLVAGGTAQRPRLLAGAGGLGVRAHAKVEVAEVQQRAELADMVGGLAAEAAAALEVPLGLLVAAEGHVDGPDAGDRARVSGVVVGLACPLGGGTVDDQGIGEKASRIQMPTLAG